MHCSGRQCSSIYAFGRFLGRWLTRYTFKCYNNLWWPSRHIQAPLGSGGDGACCSLDDGWTWTVRFTGRRPFFRRVTRRGFFIQDFFLALASIYLHYTINCKWLKKNWIKMNFQTSRSSMKYKYKYLIVSKILKGAHQLRRCLYIKLLIFPQNQRIILNMMLRILSPFWKTFIIIIQGLPRLLHTDHSDLLGMPRSHCHTKQSPILRPLWKSLLFGYGGSTDDDDDVGKAIGLERSLLIPVSNMSCLANAGSSSSKGRISRYVYTTYVV